MPYTLLAGCWPLHMALALPPGYTKCTGSFCAASRSWPHRKCLQQLSAGAGRTAAPHGSSKTRPTCPPRCTLAVVAAVPRCCLPALCHTLQRRWWQLLAWRLARSQQPGSLEVAGCLSCCAWWPGGGTWLRRCTRAVRRGWLQGRGPALRPAEQVLGVAGRLQGQRCVWVNGGGRCSCRYGRRRMWQGSARQCCRRLRQLGMSAGRLHAGPGRTCAWACCTAQRSAPCAPAGPRCCTLLSRALLPTDALRCAATAVASSLPHTHPGHRR
jgi:hypothetical protein